MDFRKVKPSISREEMEAVASAINAQFQAARQADR